VKIDDNVALPMNILGSNNYGWMILGRDVYISLYKKVIEEAV